MFSATWSAALHQLSAARLVQANQAGEALPVARQATWPAAPAATETGLVSRTESVSFGAALDKAWNQVRSSQQQADQMAQAVASGSVQGPDLVTAINATQQAALLLSLVVTVRNRAVEAYQEIMRQPV